MSFAMQASLSSTTALPRHVAIVMDGNGRWATRRRLPRLAGHRQGVEALKGAVRWALQRHVPVLTVFAFSSENWGRPAEEVGGLMELLALALSREVPELCRQGVRLRFPGEREGLSPRVRRGLADAESLTQDNQRLHLNVCFNYGGRWDVVQAARRLAQQGVEITESSLHQATALAETGDPDLIVRTGGERRLSNFLLWQAAYAELYFSDVLWPDMDEAELDRALADFAARDRRFGKVCPNPAAGETHA